MATGEPDWNAAALRRQLGALWPGLGVEIVDETASTNTDLLERARAAGRTAGTDGGVQVRRSVESTVYAGPPQGDGFEPCLRVAVQQTGGRGRLGRTWHSERGASLTFSLALPLARSDLSGLSLAVGVVLAEALDVATAPRIGLKWPNDLWLLDAPGSGRKLGGVLIETVPLGLRRVAIIGIGLNVRPIAAGSDVASGYACLHELNPDASAPALLDRIAGPLVEAVQLFERTGFAAFRERYAARDLLFGQPVRTTQVDLPEGIGRGITAQGALVVRTPEGMLRSVASGEVSVRVGATPAATPC